MSPSFMALLLMEGVLTAAAILMFLYRGILDMKEEDHIILDNAEPHFVREQAAIRQKVNWLSKYIKVVGVAWGLLAVVLVSFWIVESLNLV